MVAVPQPLATRVTSSDRLGLTLFFAVVLHAIIILGVTFAPEDESIQEIPPSLDITLVHQQSNEEIEDAELLAQANLAGGGNADETSRLANPASTAAEIPDPGSATASSIAASPPPQEAKQSQIVMTQEKSKHDTVITELTPEIKQQTQITAAELRSRSKEIAALSAEINRTMENYAGREKHRFISARTREFRDAAYLDAWRSKIERIGNINYPEAARQKNLSGTLILDVALRPNGTVREITIRRSSGHKILDDAAKRIVRLAAPFSPFPKAMKKDTDILHITRTWQFLSENRLQTN
jgi:protein TonB